jgi:hypothetical protein
MVFNLICQLLLGLTLVFAARKGDEPERLAAIILFGMFAFDIANHLLFGDPTWFEVNPGHFVIDTWALLTFGWVALRANRAWPLWVCATQLLVEIAHLSKLLEFDEGRRSYWIMTHLPVLLELVGLAIGTWVHVVRRRRIGPYASWRPALA